MSKWHVFLNPECNPVTVRADRFIISDGFLYFYVNEQACSIACFNAWDYFVLDSKPAEVPKANETHLPKALQ